MPPLSVPVAIVSAVLPHFCVALISTYMNHRRQEDVVTEKNKVISFLLYSCFNSKEKLNSFLAAMHHPGTVVLKGKQRKRELPPCDSVCIKIIHVPFTILRNRFQTIENI